MAGFVDYWRMAVGWKSSPVSVIGERFSLVGSEDRARNVSGSSDSLFTLTGPEDRKQNLVGI